MCLTLRGKLIMEVRVAHRLAVAAITHWIRLRRCIHHTAGASFVLRAKRIGHRSIEVVADPLRRLLVLVVRLLSLCL